MSTYELLPLGETVRPQHFNRTSTAWYSFCRLPAPWRRSPTLRRGLYLCIAFTAVLLLMEYTFTSVSIDRQQLRKLNGMQIYVAANLYNNEKILPMWIDELYKLLKFFGPKNVYVSIFENGSTDKTKQLLHSLKDSLNKMDVRNTIITDPTPKNYERRIPYLAQARNKVVEPMIKLYEDWKFDKVLFLNDILFSVGEIIMLIQSDIFNLLTTNDGNYDAACGMDFYGAFYDEFATREITGLPIGSGYYPFFADYKSRQSLINGLPVPVYSCWNGMIALNPEPFIKYGVKFRAVLPQRSQVPFEASECCLVHSDFRQLNYSKIYINPNVKVFYEESRYNYVHYVLPIINMVMWLFNHPKPLSDVELANLAQLYRSAADLGVKESDFICLQR
ncbi:cryptococcal mannosyltransferase 1-domain-containing protein [Endogone sp. FLAS-F59071]|nr:cryptococcal mannosyltransferase 1-domain-containing protein [Endogone sp. FLAS-F59071]|eukprot:RUS22285.1 cryptococcal mannosyltransferase 1-domain-containing protein [Endogone sp. FLAS-F59071]